MKTHLTIFKVILTAFIVLFLFGCKKETPEPEPFSPVKTIGSFGVTSNSFGSVGEISYGSTVSARGVCWSTHPNVSTSDNKTSDGTGSGLFISNVTGLTPGGKYYFRAYATYVSTTAEHATYYGEEWFVTLPVQ